MSRLCRTLLVSSSKHALKAESVQIKSTCQLRHASTISVSTVAGSLTNEAPGPNTPRPSMMRARPSKTARSRQVRPQSFSDGIPQAIKDQIVALQIGLKSNNLTEVWKAWIELRKNEELNIDKDIFTPTLRFLYKEVGLTSQLNSVISDYLRMKKWGPIQSLMGECMKAKKYQEVEHIVTLLFTSLHRDDVPMEGTHSPPRFLMSKALVYMAVALSKRSTPTILPLISLVKNTRIYQINLNSSGTTKNYEATSNGSPITMVSAIKLLQDLFDDAKDAKLAYTYCRHAILAWGLQVDHKSKRTHFNYLTRRILHLFGNNDFENVQVLMATGQEAISEEYGSWLSMTHTNEEGYEWNARTWSILIRGGITHKRPDIALQAWNLYNQLKPENESPDAQVWLGFLIGYSNNGFWSNAQECWKQMLASGTKPDGQLYSTMILALFRAGQTNEGASMFLEMTEKIRRGELEINAMAYSAILHGMLFAERVAEASEILKSMQSGIGGFPRPITSCYNVFLRYYARKQDFEGIITILQNLANDENVQPDAVTFTTLMSAYTDAGIEGAAEKVYNLMQDVGIKETNISITSMIKSLVVRVGQSTEGPADFVNTFKILEEMEKNGPHPTEVTYTSIMSALIYHGDHFNALFQSGQILGKYYFAMVKNDPSKDIGVFNKLKPNLRLCLLLLGQMQRVNLRCNRVTCHTLLAGLLADPLTGRDNNSKSTNIFCLRQAMFLFQYLQSDEGVNAKSWLLLLQRLMVWLNTSLDRQIKEEVNENLSLALGEVRKSEFMNDQDVAETVQLAEQLVQ